MYQAQYSEIRKSDNLPGPSEEGMSNRKNRVKVGKKTIS